MTFNQKEYIKKYNKSNYRMFQFRVKIDEDEILKRLKETANKNSYIKSLILADIGTASKDVYSIKQIKKIIIPILNKYDIKEIYLFGSYARGEANKYSDLDIYCDRGSITTLIDQIEMEEELKRSLNKEVDVVFIGSKMDDYFRKQIMEDMIKLC